MNKRDLFFGVIIAGLLVFIFFTRSCDYSSGTTKHIETDTTRTVTGDSVEIDWSWLNLPDTVYKEVEVPVPVKEESSGEGTIRTYKPSYQDSLIHARWTLVVAGRLISQDFQYVPQISRVGIKTITKWNTIRTNITKTITVTPETSGYLTAGGMVGVWPDRIMLGPVAGWNSPRGDHLGAGYDAINGGIMINGQIRISFKRLLGF